MGPFFSLDSPVSSKFSELSMAPFIAESLKRENRVVNPRPRHPASATADCRVVASLVLSWSLLTCPSPMLFGSQSQMSYPSGCKYLNNR